MAPVSVSASRVCSRHVNACVSGRPKCASASVKSVAAPRQLQVSGKASASASASRARAHPRCEVGVGKATGDVQRRGESQRCYVAKPNGSAVVMVAAGVPPAKAKKPRLPALDALRFFLIAYIATGHFVAFATPDKFLLAFFSQINVVVGAFFVISGYVAAYTSTELNAYEATMSRLEPALKWSVARVMGFYPLFLLIQVVFTPMFAFADMTYNGLKATLLHALMTFTLVQAWFPMKAELWNAPTWFLSALAFSMFVLPYALKPLAEMKKVGLKKAFLALTVISCIAKLAYTYDVPGALGLLEGMGKHPNLVFFNVMRFNPFYAVLEVLMGAVACRLVMTDNAPDRTMEQRKEDGAVGALTAPFTLAVAMVGLLAARAFAFVNGVTLPVNDMIVRGFVFIPLWCLFLMQVHRATVSSESNGGLTEILAKPFLVFLGGLSFPLYLLHGPLGQLFYKKVIAKQMFGATMASYFGYKFFPVYVGITVLCSYYLTKVMAFAPFQNACKALGESTYKLLSA